DWLSTSCARSSFWRRRTVSVVAPVISLLLSGKSTRLSRNSLFLAPLSLSSVSPGAFLPDNSGSAPMPNNGVNGGHHDIRLAQGRPANSWCCCHVSGERQCNCRERAGAQRGQDRLCRVHDRGQCRW